MEPTPSKYKYLKIFIVLIVAMMIMLYLVMALFVGILHDVSYLKIISPGLIVILFIVTALIIRGINRAGSFVGSKKSSKKSMLIFLALAVGCTYLFLEYINNNYAIYFATLVIIGVLIYTGYYLGFSQWNQH